MNLVDEHVVMPFEPELLFYWSLAQNVDRAGQVLVAEQEPSLACRVSCEAGLQVSLVQTRDNCALRKEQLTWEPAESKVSGQLRITRFEFCLGAAEEIAVPQGNIKAGFYWQQTLQEEFRIATIDGHFGMLKNLCWIHLNDLGYLVDILAGADAVLRTRWPVVTFRSANNAILALAANTLAERQYELYDVCFSSLDPGALEREYDCVDFLAVRRGGKSESLVEACKSAIAPYLSLSSSAS